MSTKQWNEGDVTIAASCTSCGWSDTFHHHFHSIFGRPETVRTIVERRVLEGRVRSDIQTHHDAGEAGSDGAPGGMIVGCMEYVALEFQWEKAATAA